MYVTCGWNCTPRNPVQPRRGGHYDPQHDSCFTDPETVDTYCYSTRLKLFRAEIGKRARVGATIIVVPGAPTTCTIRVRIFVLRTPIIPANTAGTTPINYRTGIGKGRVVVAMISVEDTVVHINRPEL